MTPEQETSLARIEAYCEKRMTEADRAAFEAELKTDPALAASLRLHQETLALLEIESRRRWKEKLAAVESQIGHAQIKPLNRWYAVAAAVAVLLVSGGIFSYSTGFSSRQMAQERFEPYPDLYTVKGDNSSDTFQAAMQAYHQGAYAEAAARWQSLSDSAWIQPARFYAGVALLANHQPSKALETWKTVSDPGILREALGWYRALALLEAGRVAEARTALEAILTQTDNSYAPRARQLLQKLDSPWRQLPWVS